MSRVTLIGAFAICLMLLIGCEKEEVKTPPPATPAAPTTPADGAKTAVPDMKAPEITPPVTGAMSDAQSQAQQLIAQATQYIKDNKLTDADTVLTKLEGMKASLPESMQKQITSLRDSYNALKATGGMKMPSGDGMKMPTTLPGAK